MAQVEISKALYERAVRAAAADGKTVEAFVAAALEARLRPDSVELSAEELAELDRIHAEMQAGKVRTEAELDQLLAERTARWRVAKTG
jgi:transcription initiation factor TFIIIB Brf1 subunit/transcription initiation factor TFIIB